MKRHRLVLLALSVTIAPLLIFPQPASAVPHDGNPKIVLHVRPTTTKNQCNVAALADCQAAIAEGSTGVPYFAFVLAARGNLPSVSGLQFGIQYETGCPGDRSNGNRLEIVPRPVDALAKLADCGSFETILPTSALGKAAFSTGGASPGCNPCDGPCAPPSVTGCVVPPDVIPPNPVGDLSVIATTGSSISIRWTNTGDDGFTGPATALDIRYSLAPITESNFNMAINVIPAVVPAGPGVIQQRTITGLAGNTTFHFAMKVVDEQPNYSALSNVVSGTTGMPPPPDATPSGTITNLSVIGQTSSSLTIRWTVPGDDGVAGGAAAAYDIRYSAAPINDGNFALATPVAPPPGPPSTPGTFQNHTLVGLASNTLHHIAMKTLDEVPNISGLSNLATGTAPGDDAYVGTATSYDVRYSNTPITSLNFNAASQATGEPPPGPALSLQMFTIQDLGPNVTWHFAVKSADEVGNISGISNVVSATVPSAPPAENSRTSLLLHVTAVTPAACGGVTIGDCRDAVTRGGLLPGPRFVYLLAGQHAEIAGIECGITYDDGPPTGRGDLDELDVFSWTLCADLQFSSITPAWPEPGSGNLMTWSTAHCQVTATAVAGYFYVGAYGPDEMRLTVRPASGFAKVATCASAETVLPAEALGTAVFSAGASVEGYNPCDRGVPTGVHPISWSRIKVLAGAAAKGARKAP